MQQSKVSLFCLYRNSNFFSERFLPFLKYVFETLYNLWQNLIFVDTCCRYAAAAVVSTNVQSSVNSNVEIFWNESVTFAIFSFITAFINPTDLLESF